MEFDFDSPVDRTGTASFKWEKYAPDVLPLWVADMDFASPPAVVEALRARADHGVFGYSLVPDSLTEAVCAHLAGRYGWSIRPEWLVWLPSVVPGLNLAALAFARPDDAVMTVTPVYPPFLQAPANQGRRLITVPALQTDGRWELPLAAMEEALTPDTRVLFFCHPHNPFSRVWREHEVVAVTEFCRRHDLVLVSDEIHCDLILDPLEHVPAAVAAGRAGGGDERPRLVTLMSPSKTFNLPGLNFAFAVIEDEELRARFTAPVHGLLPFPGCFAIDAAEAAYRHGGDWLAQLLDYLRGNRDLIERTVAGELPGVSVTHVEATYLAWLDVRGLECRGLDGRRAARACLDAGLALSPGADFGGPGYLRLNFGCPRATLQEALRRLQLALG
jgi:cysteine-S-conjugate beta-lyase